MKHTISKQELKRADHLTQAGRELFGRVLANQKLVLGVASIVILVGVGFVVWEQATMKKEMADQEEFYNLEKAYLKKKEAFDKIETDKKEDKKTAVKKENTPAAEAATGDLTKDYGPEVEGWLKLVDSRPGSKVGAMSALELSQIYINHNKKNEALQILAKVKNQQSSDNLLGALVFHAYANLLSGQNQCQDAVVIWENLEKKKKLGFLVEQAQMGHALCLESLGQTEKAESILKDLVAGKSSNEKQGQSKDKTQTQRTAEKFLRSMQLKKNMGTSKS